MFHTIYVSSAVEPMSNEDLKKLLHTCRINNERNRITGMLLYKRGHFMQVIEGDEESVSKLMKIIETDVRHKNIDILRSGYIQSRDFPNWSMGFQNLESNTAPKIPGGTKFLENNFTPEYFAEHASEAHALLLAFKRNSRRSNSFTSKHKQENSIDQSKD